MQQFIFTRLRRLLLLAVVAGSLCLAQRAKAETVTYNISFTASGDVPASGSFTLTIDPTQTYTNTTLGLNVISFSDTFSDPQFAFDYDPAFDALTIGGLFNGVQGKLWPGYNDFMLDIYNLGTTPAFGGFVAVTAGNDIKLYVSHQGEVDVSQVASTPEPSSLILLGTGVLAAAGAVRKRMT